MALYYYCSQTKPQIRLAVVAAESKQNLRETHSSGKIKEIMLMNIIIMPDVKQCCWLLLKLHIGNAIRVMW
jgi:hypothetical protein